MNCDQLPQKDPAVDVDGVVWMWKSNKNPFDPKELDEWMPYSPAISAIIENAYDRGEWEIRINENYTIDLRRILQINIRDADLHRPVKRCNPEKVENKRDWRSERFGFQLDKAIQNGIKANTSEDGIKNKGSDFITDWLYRFTHGKLNVAFDAIFPVLIDGIQTEGQLEKASKQVINELISEFEKTREEVKHMKEAKSMESLMSCCAKLYTKQCFLFRLVNVTLRDDDRTKLNTLGPYCYLLFNYIGFKPGGIQTIPHRLHQRMKLKRRSAFFVYRGDFITSEKLEEYQKAAGQPNKYFRWLSFVSTSRERKIGEEFAKNVLYVIQLSEAMLHDQFIDLCNSEFSREAEVLLPPGVRFRLKSVTFDSAVQRNVVNIEVVPSYLSEAV